jgi:elongation factor Ts
MAITAKDVNALRQKTGMGMMECKKALTDADGDVEKAVELLRERAGGKMDTREADAGEGAIAVAVDDSGEQTAIAIVKVMSETDFAARNADFLAKTQHIADHAVKLDKAGEIEANDAMNALIEDLRITIKEKITFGGGYRLVGDQAASYVHTDRKSGAILTAEGGLDDELMRGICMHITAMAPPAFSAPLAVDKDSLPLEEVEKAKAGFTKEAEDTGKPPQIAEKIAMGKMNKWTNENTLLGQDYLVKQDEKKPVGEYLPKDGKITAFKRLAVG